jgi:hypothetical protein
MIDITKAEDGTITCHSCKMVIKNLALHLEEIHGWERLASNEGSVERK